MSLQKYSAVITTKTEVNQKYLLLHCELQQPHRLSFVAGQYVILDIPGQPAKRQYSIASEPEMDHAIVLLIDITPAGPGSSYLATRKVGDKIEFFAPVGRFVLADSAQEKSLVFVATGTGIAPLRSMMDDLLITQKDPRSITLYWGMRHTQDLFWEEELYEMDKEYENFSFEIILSEPPENWKLSKGHVLDLLEGYQKNYQDVGFYICGSRAMVESVSSYVIDHGANKELVHHELFY